MFMTILVVGVALKLIWHSFSNITIQPVGEVIIRATDIVCASLLIFLALS